MLSVIIISKNEETTIGRCLRSVQWAKQIVVVDAGSRDRTVEIAQSLGAEVLSADWPGFGVQKQRALTLANQTWVLSLDADEYLSDSASTKIQQAIQTARSDAFILPIQMIFQGKRLKFAGLTHHLRLFKRDKAKFSHDQVHEKVLLNPGSRTSSLAATILHESYQDWSDAIDKMNHYSSLSAQITQQPTTIYAGILGSIWMFLRNLLIKGWIFDGGLGLALASYQAQSSWYRYLKRIYKDGSSYL